MKNIFLSITCLFFFLFTFLLLSCSYLFGDNNNLLNLELKYQNENWKPYYGQWNFNQDYQLQTISKDKHHENQKVRQELQQILTYKQLYKTISSKAVNCINEIIKMRNNDVLEWHLIGEPLLDAINNIRYIIYKNAQWQKYPQRNNLNAIKVKNYLRDFVKETFPKKFKNNHWLNSSNKQNVQWGDWAIYDINKWLSESKPALFPLYKIPLNQANNLSSQSNPLVDPIHNQLDTTFEQQAQMHPLRLSKKMFAGAQWRVQQIEWNGQFDMHQSWSTNQKAQNNAPHPYLDFKILPPKYLSNWAKKFIFANENWVFSFEVQNDSDSRAINNNPSETNIYDAMLNAVSVMYDDTDQEGSTGHRSNYYLPQLDLFGYSMSLDHLIFFDNPSPLQQIYLAPYFLTWTKKYYENVDIKNASNWIVKLFGKEIYQKVFKNIANSDLFGFLQLIFKFPQNVNFNKNHIFSSFAKDMEELNNNKFIIRDHYKFSGLTMENMLKLLRYETSKYTLEIQQKNIPLLLTKNFDDLYNISQTSKDISLFQAKGIDYHNKISVKTYDINHGGTFISSFLGVENNDTFDQFFLK